jgi:predicted AAA+ superfamily ATPase
MQSHRERLELERQEARRKVRQATHNAMADVLVSLAQSQAVTALLHPDPKASAEAFAESQRNVMRSAIVRAGLEPPQ